MDIHGIVASGLPYNRLDKTITLVEGADVSSLEGSYLYYNTGEPPMGIVKAAKRVLTLQDCASDADRGLWDLAGGKPFVRASVQLVMHQDVWSEHFRLNPRLTYWHAMGSIFEREGDTYTKTRLKDILLDITGRAAPTYRVFLGKG